MPLSAESGPLQAPERARLLLVEDDETIREMVAEALGQEGFEVEACGDGLQALALLNNRFVLRMSDHFAERLQHVSVDPREQLRLALRLAIAREPTEAELNLLVEFAREKGLPQACRLIFNLNEFAFVD